MTKQSVSAKRSCKDGFVKVAVDLTAFDWHGPSIKIVASADMDVIDARALANDLLTLADAAEAKFAKKQAAHDRRRKWREREIAAGRMIVFAAPADAREGV